MQQQIENTALAFMRDNLAQHLTRDRNLLVDRCANTIHARFDIPAQKAYRISMQALSEVESAGKAHFDISVSSQSMFVLRVQKTGEKIAISAADVLDALHKGAIPYNYHC